VAGVFVLFGYLRRKATEIAVTNKRIVIKTGLLTRRTFELLLSKVESIGVEEGLLGRSLGYGLAVVSGHRRHPGTIQECRPSAGA